MRIPDSLSDPAQRAFVVTPADADFADSLQARALYVGVTGDVRVTTVGGDDVTFTNVPVGFFPVSVKRVWSTGTTASGIRGVW
jgi:hypothetical protein